MSTEQDKTLKREDELRDISEIPEVQKGLYAPQKRSLFGKVADGVSGLGSKISHQAAAMKENVLPHHEHTETSTEHPKTLFGFLNSGISGLASGISHTLHNVTGSHSAEKSSEEKPEHPGNLASNVTQVGSIDAEVHLAQELESKPEEGVLDKISKAVEDYKDEGVIISENTITPNREGPSTLDKINEQYGKAADKIASTLEQVKEAILPAGVRGVSDVSEKEEDSDSTVPLTEEREILTKLVEAPTHEINPAELKEFHDIKTGFSETVDEFKHEHRVEELGGKKELVSSNPFDALGREQEEEEGEEDLPEEKTKLFGDITNKNVQEKSEGKSFAQVVKGGLTDVSAKLSSTLSQANNKIITTMENPDNKENVTRIA